VSAVLSRRSRFRGATAALLLFAGVLAGTAAGAAEPTAVAAGPVVPTQWPSSFLAAPQIEGWPNALRISGADRYQTSLAASLMLRGQGGFPFETPDPSSGGVRSLSQADGWWGLGVCPKAVIIVAGDSPADALAAASLSDSTGRSSEPYLRRSSAADPLFDPPGGFARVDTFAAPILLTPSAREGATALAVPVRLAAQDLRSGGCNTARQAIIVGGTAAVAPEIESELVSIGYTEVFRVGGANRFGTAAAVATALGTAPVPAGATGCADPSAADGTATVAFWANSVVEWRENPEECRLLGRTVVLTDGVDGIDAIAAGWWTSFWQVPVLLHNGTDELPTETATALSLLDVENIVVLGGLERLSQPAVRSAARLARANTIRVAGADRYGTSVAMAEHFGGWWPSGSGDDFASSMLCLVASSDSGRQQRGWADALSAGPWCGAATASSQNAPARMLPPVEVSQPAVVPLPEAVQAGASRTGTSQSGASQPDGPQRDARPTRSAVPMLLVPAGADRLPDSVAAFLLDAFAAPEACESQSEPVAYAKALAGGVCPAPGFAVAFGGAGVITPSLLSEVSAALSGNQTSQQTQPVLVGAQTPDPFSPYGVQATPGVDFGVGAFATTMSMAPIFRSDAAGVQVCMPRGTYAGARWIVAEASGTSAVVEVPKQGWYQPDSRSAGRGVPACIGLAESLGAPLLARGVGPSGAATDSLMLIADTGRRFSLTGAIDANEPSTVGTPSELDPPEGGHTRWLFQTGAVTDRAMLGARGESIVDTRIVLHLYRGAAPPGASGPPGQSAPDTFTATWHIRTERGTLIGSAQGEAVLNAGVWQLRGATVLTAGTWASLVYGPPVPPVSDEGPPPVREAGTPFDPLRAGTSDGYGAGGFTATLTVNSPGTTDDKLSWQPEAFINKPLS